MNRLMEYQTKLNMSEMAANQEDIKAAKLRSNLMMQMAPFLQSIGGMSNMGGLAVPGGLASGSGILGTGGGMTGGEWDASRLFLQMRNTNGTVPPPYQIPPPSYPQQQTQPNYSTQIQAMQQQSPVYSQNIQYHFPLVSHARGHENTTTNNSIQHKLNQQGAKPNHRSSTALSNPNIITTNLPQKEII